MVNIKKSLDEGLENLEKGFTGQVKTTAKAVGSQFAPLNQSSQQHAQSDQGTSEAGQHSGQWQQQSDQATEDVVNSFYAPSQAHKGAEGEGKEASEYVKEHVEKGMEVEEAVKLESLRKKLHDETYYIPLTKRKTFEEEHKEEEQEKEQEKKMDELQLEDKKKKDDDIAIQQSQQRTEKFPGASG